MANLLKKNVIYMRSMGKCFLVTAIFDNDDEANEHMEKTGCREGVIGVIGNHVYLASMYDQGIKDPNLAAKTKQRATA